MGNFFKKVGLMFFALFVTLMLLFVVTLGMLKLFSGKKSVTVAENSVLYIDLTGLEIKERQKNTPLANLPFPGKDDMKKVGLDDIIASLKRAKADKNIKGIMLNAGPLIAGWASIESFKEALEDFKTSKKFIYAYSEIYSEKSYYLATVADSIFIYPQGFIEFNGFASNPMFFKGLLDKLDIQPLVFRVGTFKSAVEPFILDKMSDANREQTSVLLNDFWSYFLSVVSKKRNISIETLTDLANQGKIENARSAVENKLADKLAYEDEVIDLCKKQCGLDAKKDLNQIKLGKYIDVSDDQAGLKVSNSDKKIAVVYGVGDINSGKGGDESIGSETVVKALRKARTDENVKAVVLRVNSPGGSALASDVIWREIVLTKKVKPIIASFGDVAASGGYYISAACDQIVAQPNTITGSIGVFGLMYNSEKLFKNKLGITFDRVVTNTMADLGNPNRAMTEAEAKLIQKSVEDIYGVFLNVVKNGRPGKFQDSLAVDAVGQGRVWSGTRGVEKGLVDELGGLDKAILLAAKKAGLGDDYQVIYLPKEKELFESLFDDGAEEVKSFILEKLLLKEQKTALQYLQNYNDPRGIYMRMTAVPSID